MRIKTLVVTASQVQALCWEAEGLLAWKVDVTCPVAGSQSSLYQEARIERVRAQMVPMTFILASQ